MTCIFLQDWRLVKVAGGLVCLGVSMSFMSIFDTARCLERLSMPGPGLGQLNPWVKRVFFLQTTPWLPSSLAVEMPSSFNIFMHRKTWLASAQTLEISRRSHRRSPIRQVSDAMLFAFMTDEDWRTNWCSRVFVCFAQWDLHMCFFPTSYNCMSEFVLAWSSEVLKYCSIGWFASNCQWPQGWSLKQWFFARKQHGLPPNPNIPEQLGSFWVPSCPVPIWCTLHT